MEKRAFIDDLKKLTETEDILAVGRDVDELRQQFEDYLLEANRLMQVAELEAREKGEELEQEDWISPLKNEFYEIFSAYKTQQKELRDKQRAFEEDNLRQKRALINQFQALIADEENIGVAFSTHKEISEKWKTIGDIPRVKRHEIQQEFSRLQEEFFYNMRIYKDIKEYDFQKNFEAKQNIISKLQSLVNQNEIKNLEVGIKELQNDWEDIGPTKQELWDKIKDEYWATVNQVYDKIRSFYEERKKKSEESIQQKKELIQKMEEILASERDSVKTWTKHTQQVLDLQDKWKHTGIGQRKESEQVWKDFRGLCDQFFELKGNFFSVANQEFDKVAKYKEGLIQKALKLKDSTEWNETSKAFIQLQQDWKRAGNAGKKFEQKLWKEFRSACDYFFNAKESYQAEQEKSFEGNLKEKQTLIEEIKGYTLPTDKKEALQILKSFSERFASIGYVPNQQKNQIFDAYKKAINAHYEALDLKGVEKEKVMFQARLNTLQGSSDAAEMLAKEKFAIRNEINKVKQQIIQYENNLGFFANSKGTNPLLEQAEKSLKAEQLKLEALKEKLKMIPNE
ncbi:MAG: DUF349 domain-containing protein [Brumimicrobium sp.]|nr:DUF349 domain-containing protein [Brumimicrobium sp.]MCO5267562.1 DUF349 domain-containing protein [Brumimicrobium sp.]